MASIREFPPRLPSPFNGGRIVSIAVSPVNATEMIASHEFGGLWMTTDAATTWQHVDGLAAVWDVGRRLFGLGAHDSRHGPARQSGRQRRRDLAKRRRWRHVDQGGRARSFESTHSVQDQRVGDQLRPRQSGAGVRRD